MSRSDVLVDADWVEANLDDPGCRARRGRRGHQRLRQGPHPRRREDRLEDRTCRTRSAATSSTRTGFEALLSAQGIANDDTVVLYGGNNNWFAAYAYWYFKLYGHDNVKLLDGGRKKWELDSRELVKDVADAPGDAVHRQGAGHRHPRLPRRRRRRDRQAQPGRRPLARRVLRQAARPGPPARRSRRSAPATCPTARNIPWSRPPTTTAPSSPTRSSRRSTRSGVDLGKDTIAYCRIGERSAHTWFVLHELLDQAERQELRRLLDRVRLARRRADRAGGGPLMTAQGCAAPEQTVALPAGSTCRPRP